MEIKSSIVASQLAKGLGGSSPFGEYLVEQGDNSLTAEALREAMQGFDGFVDGERERVEMLIARISSPAGDDASYKAVLAELRRASAPIPATEVAGPSLTPRGAHEPFRLGDTVRTQVLDTAANAVSQAIKPYFVSCPEGQAERMPEPTSIASIVIQALGKDVNSLDAAVALSSPAVEASFTRLASEGFIFSPRHLDALKAHGFVFSAELESTARRLAQREVELAAHRSLASAGEDVDGRKLVVEPATFEQQVTSVIALCTPYHVEDDAQRELFGASLTAGIRQAAQEELRVGPAHLARFEALGYAFPDDLKQQALSLAQAHVADAVWAAFNPVSSGRVRQRSPAGPNLANALNAAISLHTTEALKGRETELYGPSVQRAFERLLGEGRTISVGEAAAAETQINSYLA